MVTLRSYSQMWRLWTNRWGTGYWISNVDVWFTARASCASCFDGFVKNWFISISIAASGKRKKRDVWFKKFLPCVMLRVILQNMSVFVAYMTCPKSVWVLSFSTSYCNEFDYVDKFAADCTLWSRFVTTHFEECRMRWKPTSTLRRLSRKLVKSFSGNPT